MKSNNRKTQTAFRKRSSVIESYVIPVIYSKAALLHSAYHSNRLMAQVY